MVQDANVLEKGVGMLIFSSPIRLDCKDFMIKEPLNKGLKTLKILKHF
jgi:hypothetical protein